MNLLHLACAIAAATGGLASAGGAWEPAKPTSVTQMPAASLAWTPKPTEGPRVYEEMRKRGHKRSPTQIFVRESRSDILCGYANGDIGDPVTCNNPLMTCMFNSVLKAIGCCASSNAPPAECGQQTSCVNFGGDCDSSCMSDTLILKCSASSVGSCATYQFESGYSNLICFSSSFINAVLQTAKTTEIPSSTSGSGAVSVQNIFSNTKPATTSPSSPASPPTPTPTPATPSSPTTPTTPPLSQTTSGGTSTDTDSKPPIGAIVGGVVGGIAVLALLGFGLVFLRRRRSDGGVQYAATPNVIHEAHLYPPHQPQQPFYDTSNEQYGVQQGGYAAPAPPPAPGVAEVESRPASMVQSQVSGSGRGYQKPPPPPGQTIHEAP